MSTNEISKKELLKKSLRAPALFATALREDGFEGMKRFSYSLYSNAHLGLAGNIGENVFEEEWDILLILDACRVDLMKGVATDFEYLPSNIGVWKSLGSKSPVWLTQTFIEDYREEIEQTAYITGNPFTTKVKLEVEPETTIEVWKSGWDEDVQTIPARPITDTAIQTWRDGGHERMIVHYMQPHGPFVNYPDLGEYGRPEDFGEGFGNLWDKVGSEIEISKLWEAYEDNLRYVLNDIEILLNNVDAEKVVISSDHGNAVGEWGFYGHPPNIILPCLREVPWIETSAEDSGKYSPKFKPHEATEDEVIEDRLEALGYK